MLKLYRTANRMPKENAEEISTQKILKFAQAAEKYITETHALYRSVKTI